MFQIVACCVFIFFVQGTCSDGNDLLDGRCTYFQRTEVHKYLTGVLFFIESGGSVVGRDVG